MPNRYGPRFQDSTRGRVVDLLRRKSRTVEELAAELNLTDNAVRTHLATLERDGIVRHEGVRRGVGAGKPASLFGISPDAEASFSNAYVPLLTTLLEELGDRHDDLAMKEIMRNVGKRMAAAYSGGADRETRLRVAATLLRELGALTEVVEENGRVVLRGHGCVVGKAVNKHASVCCAIETLLQEILAEDVHEHCDRGERPSCCFYVGPNGKQH